MGVIDIKSIVLWCTGGILYYYMEILFRGYSHISMIICGGVCFLLVGNMGQMIINHNGSNIKTILTIMICGTFIITSAEFVTGLLVNIYMGMDVWDYSEMRYNLMGQICPFFSLLWSFVSLPCVYLSGIIRKYIFEESVESA